MTMTVIRIRVDKSIRLRYTDQSMFIPSNPRATEIVPPCRGVSAILFNMNSLQKEACNTRAYTLRQSNRLNLETKLLNEIGRVGRAEI